MLYNCLSRGSERSGLLTFLLFGPPKRTKSHNETAMHLRQSSFFGTFVCKVKVLSSWNGRCIMDQQKAPRELARGYGSRGFKPARLSAGGPRSSKRKLPGAFRFRTMSLVATAVKTDSAFSRIPVMYISLVFVSIVPY